MKNIKHYGLTLFTILLVQLFYGCAKKSVKPVYHINNLNTLNDKDLEKEVVKHPFDLQLKYQLAQQYEAKKKYLDAKVIYTSCRALALKDLSLDESDLAQEALTKEILCNQKLIELNKDKSDLSLLGETIELCKYFFKQNYTNEKTLVSQIYKETSDNFSEAAYLLFNREILNKNIDQAKQLLDVIKIKLEDNDENKIRVQCHEILLQAEAGQTEQAKKSLNALKYEVGGTFWVSSTEGRINHLV